MITLSGMVTHGQESFVSYQSTSMCGLNYVSSLCPKIANIG